MSTSRDSFFSVNLRHLSPDCRRVGAELPDVQLNHLSVRQLRTLLDGAAKLAPTAVYPAEPQLRIEGTQGKFVVQLKNGTLNFISWSSSVRGTGAMTPAQVIGTILGEDTDDDEPVMAAASRSAGSGRRFSFSPTIAMYVVAIIGINSFTVWFLTRPPRTHLPSYTLLEVHGPAEDCAKSGIQGAASPSRRPAGAAHRPQVADHDQGPDLSRAVRRHLPSCGAAVDLVFVR